MTGRAQVEQVEIVRDQLVLGPVTVNFQRTLRIPETGVHPLPPGLGRFPLRRVADYPDTAPAEWLSRGGVMLPIYQREAMWLSFHASEPAALQVGVGKVCAVSGLPWIEHLIGDPQNYVALPDQPWLDGINAGDGFIRQFVAVPLGSGATVEGQVTGQETHGGVQLRAVGLTEQALAKWRAAQDVAIDCCPDLMDGNELADESVAGVDAVQPRLIGQRNVVLRVANEVLDPGQAADRTPCPRRPAAQRVRKHETTATLPRAGRSAASRRHGTTTRPVRCRVVRDPAQRKPAQTGRQRMHSRLGDSQRPLKIHRHRTQHQLVPDNLYLLYLDPVRHYYLHLGVLPI